MKNIEQLTTQMYYCDQSTNIFEKCRIIKKDYPLNILGKYGQQLDACNIKIRLAAKALSSIKKIVNELEHGEYIYLEDENRLDLSFYSESFLIFVRASLDLIISAYFTYLTGNIDLDGFNKFIKRIKNNDSILPPESKDFWDAIIEEYFDEEKYRWVHSIVGVKRGLSLRDMVVHKSIAEIDTYIDDKTKGG